MAKKKKFKMDNKMIMIIVAVAVLLLFMNQGTTTPKTGQGDGQSGGQQQAPGCTNSCTTGYNQNPYPDCTCYAVTTTTVPPGLDSDDDGIPDVTDPDDDNDGIDDDTENFYGTDPLDPLDFPGSTSDCNERCINSGYLSGYNVQSIGECNSDVPLVGQTGSGIQCCCEADNQEEEEESMTCEEFVASLGYPSYVTIANCGSFAMSACGGSGAIGYESQGDCCAYDCGWASGDSLGWSSGQFSLSPGDRRTTTHDLYGMGADGQPICITVERSIEYEDWREFSSSDMVYLYVKPSIGNPFTFADRPLDDIPTPTVTIPFSGSYGYAYGVPFEFEFVNDANYVAGYDLDINYVYTFTFKIC